uniref:Uncharacterized protein n=1 Tax=Anopheles atroparvus TaxID=41427 RepID=A0A182J5N5_ANOAO
MIDQTNCITLKGSAQIVAQYLYYAMNSILYQRGIYASKHFVCEEKYGIVLLVSKNKNVRTFFDKILNIVEEWLPNRKIKRISMVIIEVATRKPLERWDFTVENGDDAHPGGNSELFSTKSLKATQAEIRNVMRQITSSISFLPLIENRATFDVLIYPKPSEYNKHLPAQWEWKSANDITIANSQLVRMQSFSTGIDKVDTAVVYRMIEE